MPTLKLVIVPAKILSNGKHKVRISVSHNSQTRYIPTDCIIDDLSQFKEGQVVNRSDASYMNMKLRKNSSSIRKHLIRFMIRIYTHVPI